MEKKVHFSWLKSILVAFRDKKISRERFVYEYAYAQKTLRITRRFDRYE